MNYCVEFIVVGIGFFMLGFYTRGNIEPYWS